MGTKSSTRENMIMVVLAAVEGCLQIIAGEIGGDPYQKAASLSTQRVALLLFHYRLVTGRATEAECESILLTIATHPDFAVFANDLLLRLYHQREDKYARAAGAIIEQQRASAPPPPPPTPKSAPRPPRDAGTGSLRVLHAEWERNGIGGEVPILRAFICGTIRFTPLDAAFMPYEYRDKKRARTSRSGTHDFPGAGPGWTSPSGKNREGKGGSAAANQPPIQRYAFADVVREIRSIMELEDPTVGPDTPLTDKQLEILEALANRLERDGRARGFSDRDIAFMLHVPPTVTLGMLPSYLRVLYARYAHLVRHYAEKGCSPFTPGASAMPKDDCIVPEEVTDALDLGPIGPRRGAGPTSPTAANASGPRSKASTSAGQPGHSSGSSKSPCSSESPSGSAQTSPAAGSTGPGPSSSPRSPGTRPSQPVNGPASSSAATDTS